MSDAGARLPSAWRRLHARIAAVCATNSFYLILDPYKCGPFDGGCAMVAEALRRALQDGEIAGCWSANGEWQHAVLHIEGLYLDGNGVQTEAALQAYWHDQEFCAVRVGEGLSPRGLRPLGVPYDESTIRELTDLFIAREITERSLP